MTGTITIPNGVKFAIFNNAAEKTVTVKRGGNFTGTMFLVEEGGSLQINGYEWNDGQWNNGPLVIDGNGKSGYIIDCSGKLALRDTVVRNNSGGSAIYLHGSGSGERYDTAHNKGVTVEITRTKIENCSAPNGGGIKIGGDTPDSYSIDIWYSMFYNCTAIDASAIYLWSAGQATVTMRNSVVDNCDQYTGGDGQYGGAIRTNGNGKYKLTMTDCVVRNCDSWKFGGGIYWNASGTGSKLIVTDCQFLNNSAVEMGGGMFLEGSDMVINATSGKVSDPVTSGIPGNLTGTLIQGNSAPNGGGISYKCYSNSADVQVPTTVANFNENVIFNQNTGKNGSALAYNLHDTHNYPNGATFTFNINGAQFSNNVGTGFGGAIYINKCRDDYVCTVNFKAGAISDNSAQNGGAVAITTADGITVGGTFNMEGGSLSNNTATSSGGAVYLQNGNFCMSGGSIEDNDAVYGGAVYISDGDFEISGGTMLENTATEDGGAAYISGGDFTMSNGEMTDNEANQNGGALYVAGGNVTIQHGTLDENSATDGGAVYLAGDANTVLSMESGQMKDNYAFQNGGAIYATSGTLYIGLQDCSGDKDQTMHTKKGAGRHHPLIQNNTAGTSGGGIAISKETGGTGGVVYFYCGAATGNTNSNNDKGLGKNVFMDGGEFHFYDGTNVGLPRDPDLVIVGGKLWNECIDEDWITLKYYATNDAAESSMEGLAAENEVMNLPNAEAFFPVPSGQHFAGWTAKGIASGEGSKYVRDKGEYVASGDPVEILDAEKDSTGKDSPVWDGKADNEIHLYALWVDSTYNITYVNILNYNYGTETNTPNSYDVTTLDVKTKIPAILKDGYVLKGWYIYQDLGQNANWGYEPAYVNSGSTAYSNLDYTALETATPSQYLPVADNGTLELPTGLNTFGDITLIADYELAYSDLTIRKTGAESIDENQAFIFHVVNNGLSASDNTVTNPEKKAELDAAIAAVKEALTVVVEGDGSIVIKHLPLGTYTVTEDTDWSWRYGQTSSDPANGQVTLGLNDPQTVTFTNTRTEGKWLSGDWYTENWWGETPIRKKDDYIDPTKVKTN